MLLTLGAVAASVAGVVVLVNRDDAPDTGEDRVLGHQRERRTQPPRSVSISWVGDISLSSSSGLPPEPGSLLGGVRRYLAASRLTVGNLEGTLGSGGASKCAAKKRDCFAFQAPAGYAGLLKGTGFDLMNLANNHAFDYGASGRAATIAALERHGVGHTGGPGEVLVRRAGGLKLAFLGFAPYSWAGELRDTAGATRLVGRAGRRADLVIVIMHAGAEGSDKAHTPTGTEVAFGENRGDTRGFAHAVVRAGADLVLGSGPHVLRGIERYKGRLIAYSLGNFLGFHTFSTEGDLALSGILRVTLAPSGRVAGGRWISVRLDPAGVPHLDRGHESARFVIALSRRDFGRGAFPMRSSGRLAVK